MIYLLLLIFLICGTPIAFVLGGIGIAYFLSTDLFTPIVEVQRIFAGMNSYSMLAIPLFILAGKFMSESGMLDDLIEFAKDTIGFLPGGLALSVIFVSTIFAATSGAAVAAMVAIGVILIPAMEKDGYDKAFSTGLVAGGSLISPLIPPSVAMILYGVIADLSIGTLFVAGAVPGLLMAAGLIIYVIIYVKLRRSRGFISIKTYKKSTLKKVISSTWHALPAFFMPVIVLGGIIVGWFTATEGAGIAVAYAFLVGKFFYKELKWSKLPDILLRAGMDSSIILLLLGMSNPTAWIIAVNHIPTKALNLIASFSLSAKWEIAVILLGLLVAGCLIDATPNMCIFAPILAPMAGPLGLDPIQLGVIVGFALVIGLITPPIGSVLFVASGITGLSIEKISRSVVIPFFIAVVVLSIVAYVPSVTLWLPKLLLGYGQ